VALAAAAGARPKPSLGRFRVRWSWCDGEVLVRLADGLQVEFECKRAQSGSSGQIRT
jgi:hypothetical protein